MQIYELGAGRFVTGQKIQNAAPKVIICQPEELAPLQKYFGFDESTIKDCTDLDESVRYADFKGYDFLSLVHVDPWSPGIDLNEINLYVSTNYLVIVTSGNHYSSLEAIKGQIVKEIQRLEDKSANLTEVYYKVLHYIIRDFSESLESLEDSMQELSKNIVHSLDKTQFAEIIKLRDKAYAMKKQLRALTYVGDQILLDTSGLMPKTYVQYFRNLSMRMRKLYDLAESLYSLGGELMSIYDSQMAMHTNETVNKLTVLTIFFGPLTVITGIYGMNFEFMPELRWLGGYPFSIGLMLGVSVLLYAILKRKKWL